MATLRRWSGSAWAGITRKRWDGSAWVTMGAAVVTPPDAAPIISTAAYGAATLAAGYTRHAWDSASISRYGVLPVTAGSSPVLVGNTFKSSIQDSPWTVEATLTGRRFAFHLGTGTGSAAYWLYVNGVAATALPTTNTATTVLVDLGTSATRTIRIELANARFGGIDIEAGATLAARPVLPTLGILGDSWVEGASYVGGVNDPHIRHMAYLTGKAAGYSTYIGGIGGTGYVASTVYGTESRVAPIIAAAPAYLLIFGTINDSGTGVQAAATALYADLATRAPNTKLIIVGVESYASSHNVVPASPSVDWQLKQAALAAPNVLGFISPRQEAWITGSGNTTTPAGNGTADLYHNGENLNHLSLAGNAFYAQKLATAIAGLVPA